MRQGWVKVCGVTSVADAEQAVEAGADALGINLWPHSPRYTPLDDARLIAESVRGHIAIVTVTVNMPAQAMRDVMQTVQPDFLQLHGDESDADVQALAPRAFKALGLRGPSDVQRALAVPGQWVLIDAKDDVRRGGTGRTPPDALARAVCEQRNTVLAGGLTPDNVARAIAALRPAGVDATSSLERGVRHKDPQRVITYVRQARQAFAALDEETHV